MEPSGYSAPDNPTDISERCKVWGSLGGCLTKQTSSINIMRVLMRMTPRTLLLLWLVLLTPKPSGLSVLADRA